MSENIAAAIAAKNAVIAQQSEALDEIATLLETKAAGGGTDLSLGLTSASVGQTIKVKAVDGQGVPTAWETAEMAGGGTPWVKIGEWSAPAGGQAVELIQSISGLEEYRQIKIITVFPAYATTNIKFRIGFLIGQKAQWLIYNANLSSQYRVAALINLFFGEDISTASTAAGRAETNGTWYGFATNDSLSEYREAVFESDALQPAAITGMRIGLINTATDYIDGTSVLMYGVKK